MISFVVGVSPNAPNLEARMAALIEECMNFEGLVAIRGSEECPNKILLSFRDRESATAAQWMMELGGSERKERKEDGALPEPEGGRADHGDLSGSGADPDA